MVIRATLPLHIQSMAGSSSNPTILASLSILVSERLARDNYRLWRTQVLPAIRVTQLEWFIDGSEITPVKTLEVEENPKKITVPNPEYVVWRVRDQLVKSWPKWPMPPWRWRCGR
jgi:hypothetical protein